MSNVNVLGIDLAKRVFHVVGMNSSGKVVFRKRIYRESLVEFIANHPGSLIGLEACGGSYHWAREFEKHGHNVKLMSPQFVKPYVKSNKNDMRDAEAIAEAVSRPTMRFVATKTIEQQELQFLHRVRERIIKGRTALINELRGIFGEYGLVAPKGPQKLIQRLPNLLSSVEREASALGMQLLQELSSELFEQTKKLEQYNRQLKQLAKEHPIAQRLQTIPGIGPITAMALIASVGDPGSFKNGRQFAAWLGLVPRQHSTGGVPRLLGISKRGDGYLRKLLIHGARTLVRWLKRHDDPRSQWLKQLIERRGVNRAIVAQANKAARIAWVVMTRDEEYQSALVTA